MILKLLQLSNSALPLGAYSYSEGLETAIEQQWIRNQSDLSHWLSQELSHGAIRLETALMLRAYHGWLNGEIDTIQYWNQWSSAVKETSELREQSWQMGNSLIRLLLALDKNSSTLEPRLQALGKSYNYAIALGIASAHWQIEENLAILGHLHSWTTNMVNAGVKLIPLGQTAGQQLLQELHPLMEITTAEILVLPDEDLYSCSWGLGLASMQHEIQYSRLFRS
ncbi:urease accessory protein UreF [Euhalothece natronophila Z-M001]|uniref:Urease accessory protein UreF n=1 Tax=Euhalothece natronophila Z-M001 TaxID=522448 RepID=A0A5B8NHP1_9CHRO|nr:urease accessory protein UreF [Euhalothece natronophila]QDZ38743.1 urease accessory protein UreF [Euhalothece natronophila Z-M001]